MNHEMKNVEQDEARDVDGGCVGWHALTCAGILALGATIWNGANSLYDRVSADHAE